MGNGHSAIDKLIALTTVKKYQEGGQVAARPAPVKGPMDYYKDKDLPFEEAGGRVSPYEKAISDIIMERIGKPEEKLTLAEREGLGTLFRKEWVKHMIKGWPLYESPSFEEGGKYYELQKEYEENPFMPESMGLDAIKGVDYQNGGQVLQIPQKKELDIVWPVDGESPEDMEQAKYNPVTELLLEALFEKLKRQQGQQRKPGKQLDPEAIKLYTIAQPDVV